MMALDLGQVISWTWTTPRSLENSAATGEDSQTHTLV